MTFHTTRTSHDEPSELPVGYKYAAKLQMCRKQQFAPLTLARCRAGQHYSTTWPHAHRSPPPPRCPRSHYQASHAWCISAIAHPFKVRDTCFMAPFSSPAPTFCLTQACMVQHTISLTHLYRSHQEGFKHLSTKQREGSKPEPSQASQD
jgi:hypothetical protein